MGSLFPNTAGFAISLPTQTESTQHRQPGTCLQHKQAMNSFSTTLQMAHRLQLFCSQSLPREATGFVH